MKPNMRHLDEGKVASSPSQSGVLRQMFPTHWGQSLTLKEEAPCSEILRENTSKEETKLKPSHVTCGCVTWYSHCGKV